MENYKEKYKNLIEKLKKAKEEHGGYTFSSVVDKIVPELCENEDERIRKEILEYFQQFENEELHGVNISDWISWLEKQGEQKSWSEEDIAMIQNTIYWINEFQKSDRCKDENDMQNSVTCENWLKSLKDRIQPQSHQEWSEEDREMLYNCLGLIQEIDSTQEEQKWLKSLKPQKHWKPSKEQLEALKFAANDYCMGETKKNLESLYNNLKKL